MKPSTFRSRLPIVALVAQLACGHRDQSDDYARGHLLTVAVLPAGAEPRILDAAIRAAFDVDPALVLVMHPRRLPRTAGDDGGDSVPSGLVRSLRERGLVRGLCEPQRSSPRDTPRCSLPQPGYIVRASDVFSVSRDTVQVNFAAEKFGAATGQKPEALRFEKIYQLVRQGTGWRVVREARAP